MSDTQIPLEKNTMLTLVLSLAEKLKTKTLLRPAVNLLFEGERSTNLRVTYVMRGLDTFEAWQDVAAVVLVGIARDDDFACELLSTLRGDATQLRSKPAMFQGVLLGLWEGALFVKAESDPLRGPILDLLTALLLWKPIGADMLPHICGLDTEASGAFSNLSAQLIKRRPSLTREFRLIARVFLGEEAPGRVFGELPGVTRYILDEFEQKTESQFSSVDRLDRAIDWEPKRNKIRAAVSKESKYPFNKSSAGTPSEYVPGDSSPNSL